MFRAACFSCRLASGPLLAALLLAAAPASAFWDGGQSLRGKVAEPDGYAAAIQAGASRDVRVFPIFVAGPAGVAVDRSLYRMVAQAGTTSIAVIYPDMAEPYRSVFTQIIDGIREKAKGAVADYAVGAQPDLNELNKSLRQQDARVVIALGRQGMKVASSLGGNVGVVVGGVLAPDGDGRNVQVNSLSPDPKLLFSRLKGMMPKVKRIFTVYDPRQNAWIMRLAKDAARAQGVELVTYEVQDLRSAMRAYGEIFDKADSGRDALWLPQDSTSVEEGTVLPMVLHESWNRSVAVFSSSFAHVRRGVLFSLYPDNVGLGRQLAASALDYLSSGENRASIVPLREVLMAVNVRTAKHLGIDLDQQEDIDMSFPRE